MKRLDLPESLLSQPIPRSTTKQFVLSKAPKLSEEEEIAHRQAFWFKEALIGGIEKIGQLQATWNCVRFIFIFSVPLAYLY